MAQMLVGAGANVHAADKNVGARHPAAPHHVVKLRQGNTPLHWSAEKGDLEVSQILVRAGANIYALNNKGKTPFDNAKHSPLVAFLQQGILHVHDTA
eukprot:CAMPEP_0175842890 /NCGR_PEP_ID=MMETSP0107_2-20121207/20772_1 /TAXON_ID=195067 ORGANISM="Goniomonas pacifica, Strain CCMP1869" /NCGR_SAMPLE_ID=MMETSP0107_2 /ASSEMBLY_ACC=CAM_ASM_000203 /LENGTH=96 /DNA_ID=CAMNT_0017157091 /DNA_START=288 /DNA_END=577 /DNA_ORIENTATION=-